MKKIIRAYTSAAKEQCNERNRAERKEAAKRYWNRMKNSTGLVGLGAEAVKSYKKDGNIRNAIKTATNTVVDNVTDNTKDLNIILCGASSRKSASIFVQELLK